MNYPIYTPDMVLDIIKSMNVKYCSSYDAKSDTVIKYMNEPISFDIESSSVYILQNGYAVQSDKYINSLIEYKQKDDAIKFSFMYGWTFDINDCTILGRTWEQFINILNIISNYFGLNYNKRIIVYCHNFSFEFQYLRKYFKWAYVFATDIRKPLYAVTDSGIEFRCSYRLSGYSLEKIGEQVGIAKSGDLDYLKIRHFNTELKPKEKQYMVIDVKIVSEYIRRKIKTDGGIDHIPLTKTGYVRRLFRKNCLSKENAAEYIQDINRLQLTLEEYDLAKRVFGGGYTHANKDYVRKFKTNNSERSENIVSYDIASSYPTVLACEKYPCDSGVRYRFKNREHFEREMESTKILYMFQLELEDVEPIFRAEQYISFSKCMEIEGEYVNNGRVYKAKRLMIAITNIDYQIIKRCYKYKIKSITTAYAYLLSYLPRPFIQTLFQLYQNKTTLKGVAGKEEEYLSSKEDINASFGMAVTDIIRDVIDYKTKWVVNGEEPDKYKKLTDEEKIEQLAKENNKKSRFLFFIWGLAVTAYARRNLWKAIFELGADYIYADTDSVKFRNEELHTKFFEKYNEEIQEKVNNVLEFYNLPLEYARPKTIKGIEKPLGIWEFDGHYSEFKTLGAKRYFVKYSYDQRNEEEKRGKYVLTVAGLSKKKALNYLTEFPDPMKQFRFGMHVPPDNTGKLVHTYIDEPKMFVIEDYQGKVQRVSALSSVHLSPTDYKLSISRQYSDFFKGIQTVYLK